jgi:hypothetical protein
MLTFWHESLQVFCVLLRIFRDPAWRGISILISIMRLLYRIVNARAALPGVPVANNRRKRKNVLPDSFLQQFIVTLFKKKEPDTTILCII